MTCSNCGKSNSGGMCPWCGHISEAARPTEAQLASLTRRLEQRHGVPALLSFFVPGLGQLIKGNLGMALTVWLGIAVLIVIAAAGFWPAVIGIPIVWVYSLYDAYVASDGPARREMDRIAKTMVILVACALVGAGGCGKRAVQAKQPVEVSPAPFMVHASGVHFVGDEADASSLSGRSVGDRANSIRRSEGMGGA